MWNLVAGRHFWINVFLASESLRLIDPHEKEFEGNPIARAKEWISAANVAYILGYAFDGNNNRRIGIDVSLFEPTAGHKRIMFTNYKDMNTINKKTDPADELRRRWLSASHQILCGATFVPPHGPGPVAIAPHPRRCVGAFQHAAVTRKCQGDIAVQLALRFVKFEHESLSR